MLEAQGMRAARLVVDTGIHAFDWDRERAIATMTDVGLPRTDAVIEVDRYIAMPGQALAYKLGQFEIQRWRSEAESRGAQGSPCRPSTTTCCRSARCPWPASNGSWRPPTPADRGTGRD